MTDKELRDKITQLRRERDAHQMDEPDYVEGVISIIKQYALSERINELDLAGNFNDLNSRYYAERLATLKRQQEVSE